MGQVIELEDYRPHETFIARCKSCGYRFVTVCPVFRKPGHFECPKCGGFAVMREEKMTLGLLLIEENPKSVISDDGMRKLLELAEAVRTYLSGKSRTGEGIIIDAFNQFEDAL